MKLNKLLLKAINKGIETSLLQFDDEIEFKKSNNSIQSNQQKIKHRLYDFDNCKYGDKVYYDDILGYNLISGEYYGFCCIEKGQIDEQPRFVYKEDIGEMNWNDAIEKYKEIPNCYLPNKDELKLAYDNGLKNELVPWNWYWSSTQYDPDGAYLISTDGSYVGCLIGIKTGSSLVRPFFHISQIENKVNESFDFNKDLLQFDDEIEFKKSNNFVSSNQMKIKNRLYDFDHCIYGDKVYYDDVYGYNLVSGEYIGFCCIEKGQIDEQPRFVYKEDTGHEITWDAAESLAAEIEFGYLPGAEEMQVAAKNGLNNKLSDKYYWTSSIYDMDQYYCLETHSGSITITGYDDLMAVRPFFIIPSKIVNELQESFDYNKTLITLDDEIEFTKTNTNWSKKNLVKEIEYIKFVDENFVDLCLPSGTLWCKYNLGATCGNTKESWFGDYYAWGETETKQIYKHGSYTYDGNDKELPLSNDAVYQSYYKICPNWSKIPGMPTNKQIEELIDNTKSEWVENYNEINGLNGRIFTGKNGNTLFIPAAGYCGCSGISGVDLTCHLWSKSISSNRLDRAWYLYFRMESAYPSCATGRYYGRSVRGVL